MKHTVRNTLIIAVSALVTSCSHKALPLEKFEPEDGKCYIFVGQEMEAIGGLDGYDGYVDRFESPYGITIYTNARPGDESYGYTYNGLDGLTYLSNWGAGDCFADAQLASPKLAGCNLAIGFELVNHEKQVASGEHDEYITGLADWISKYPDKQVFLRIGYEFDGHSWNHYEPESYVAAFRRIRDILEARGVDNVAYVWQSSGVNKDVDDIMSFYPGDDYVDWFAYSQFWQGRCQTMIDLAREHGKPLFIAESTPSLRDENMNDIDVFLSNPDQAKVAWERWFTELFATVEENPDVVKAVSYINCNWPSQPMWYSPSMFSYVDSRLQLDDQLASLWEQKMSEATYINLKR